MTIDRLQHPDLAATGGPAASLAMRGCALLAGRCAHASVRAAFGDVAQGGEPTRDRVGTGGTDG